MITQSSKKKSSEPWIWLLRKHEKQPEPWCLDCTLNLAILILENTHTDSSSLQPKSSVAVRVKKVRDEDYVQWLLEHEPSTCLQVDQCVWRHPVLNLHVLGNIMVDAGSRAASVTSHRVMDTEHGLGNVTGEIMLNTLLNHWVKYSGKPDIVRTEPAGASRDQGFRRGLAAKSIRLDTDLGDASWKTGVLGKNSGYNQTVSNSCGSKTS